MTVTEQEMPAPPGPKPAFEFLTLEQMLAPIEAVDWVVKGLGICPGRPAAFVGIGDSKKTTLALLLAACKALGMRFLGQFYCDAGPVIWLDYEMGNAATRRKLQRLCLGHDMDYGAVVANLRFAIYPRTFLNSPECEPELTKVCKGVRLCVVDSLRRALPGIDENDSTIADFLQMLARISEATGCAFLFIHHGSTKSDRTDKRSAARGSSAIWDGSGSHIVLDGAEDEPTRVTHVREPQEGAKFMPFCIDLEDVASDTDPKAGLRVVYMTPEQADPPEPPTDDHERNVERLVAALLKRGTATSKALVIEWAKLGTKPGRLAFDESVSRGLIINKGTARSPLLCVADSPHTPRVRESAGPGPDSVLGGADSSPSESARVRESVKSWTEANDAAE